MPIVSVVISCARGGAHLEGAVLSVVGQTFRDWECIVVLSPSAGPEAEAALVELTSRYPEAPLFAARAQAPGSAAARNVGLAQASGRHVLPLDAADRLAPSFLERTVAILDAEPNVAIVHTGVRLFGAETGAHETGPLTLERQLTTNAAPYAALIRRSVWEAVGGYDERLPAFEHWDFWLAALERGFGARGLPEPLLHHRSEPMAQTIDAAAVTARIILNHPGLYSAAETEVAHAKLPQAELGRPGPHAPKLSVVLVARDVAPALEPTLRDLLGQTLRDVEIFVVGVGARLESRVAAVDPGARVHYVHLPSASDAEARRTARQLARGRRVVDLELGAYAPTHLTALAA